MGALGLLLWLAGFVAFIWLDAPGRAALQPGLAALLDEGLRLGGVPRHRLAIDPHAALQAQAMSGALLAVAAAAAQVFRSRRAALRLANAFVATAAGVVLIAAAHRAVGATHIYVWTSVPSFSKEPFFAPFVNPNHAGILMASALPVALAIGLRSREGARLYGLAATALLLAGIWASHSRGAIGVGVMALGMMALLLGARRVRLAILGLGALGLLALFVHGPIETVADLSDALVPNSYYHDPLGQRLPFWSDALVLQQGVPWLGVGAGSFGATFPAFKTLTAWTAIDHLHQEPLQLIIEQGLPIGIGWLALAIAPLVLGIRYALAHEPGRRRDLGAALTAAYAALSLGCLWDFPLRIGAIALVFVLLGGAITGLAYGEVAPRTRPGARLALRGLALLPVLVALLSLDLASPNGGRGDLASIEADLEQARALVDQGEDGKDLSSSNALQRAERLSRQILARAPLNGAAMLTLTRSLRAQGRLEEALAAAKAGTHAMPSNPLTWVWLARTTTRLHDLESAQAAWQKALLLDLPNRELAESLVREAIRTADPDPSVAAMAAIPLRGDRLAVAGKLIAEQGDPILAELLYEQALELDPRVSLAWSAQLLRWERPEEALAVLESWPGEHCGAVKSRADAYAAMDRRLDAIAAWRSARSACKADDRSAALGLGRVLTAAVATEEESSEGIALLGQLVAKAPKDKELRRVLLGALRRAHRSDAMVPHLQALVDLGVATAGERAALTRLQAGIPSWQIEEEPTPGGAKD